MKEHHELPFFAKDVVAMIGDSITASAGWWMAFRNQLMTRHRGSFYDFRNLGVPGGGVQGALKRYEWDIAPQAPSVAMLMFGMNDVWREGYRPGAGPDAFDGRDHAIREFLSGTLALCDRLAADGVRVILLTPTPYDEDQPGEESANFRGVNQALSVCAGMVRGIAASKGFPVVDFHTPLTRLCQAGHPIVGADRVHPTPAGHQAMTKILCRQFGLFPLQAVPPGIEEASQRLFEEEHRLRILAAIRCRAQGEADLESPDSFRRWIQKNLPTAPTPWLREKMGLCLGWIGQETEFKARVELLRRELALSNP
jgi:lysophospholipase L1-like esterase